MRELKHHAEAAREGEAKQTAIVQSLRQKIVEYETTYGCIEGAANRSEHAISTLQRDSQVQQERIIDLESRIKDLLREKDEALGNRHTHERQMNEVIAKINTVLNIDGSYSSEYLSDISTRLSDLVHENSSLRSKFASMREHLENAQLEHKASRETILRLVSEAEREQKSSNKYCMEMDSLRQEREDARSQAHAYQREIELLKERLDASNHSWQVTRRELEEKEARYSDNDTRLRDHELAVRNAESAFKGFKQLMADILSDSVVSVEPYEECIRDRAKWLAHSVKDKSAHIDLLEGKVRELSSQLESQCDLHRSADSKSRRIEKDFLDLEERLRRAESELAAGEALRDGLRIDKERYMKFLETISQAMKMDSLTIDMGIDGCTDAILARADQLVRHEYDGITDKKTQLYNMQRKMKTMKEQLDSKELHMELMRKKVANLEERLAGRSDLEREKDEDIIKNRKLVKLVEKYKVELNECRLEIRDLKAQLLQSSEIRARTMETEHLLEELEGKVGQLERIREKQAKKIIEMKENLQMTESKYGEKTSSSNNTIHALSSELRTTKSSLEDISNRERQLLDLRAVMARMLGLDVNMLAVPDYEIISRLEKLILANQANTSTAIALDCALDDMQDGFRSGYEDASRALGATKAVKSHIHKTKNVKRSRSVSPNRKRDPRAY
ncbi:hypothetical protein CAPTEDRAFT_173947 [Capitella teleta]|uniref:Uncharacterized protein n=1 Tax=Capitella teleta TaxID=283909 RepID=R7VB10_CAPTE|nr:hypothetical protein CAPTEDRAFT_173947 [Capitella teleta]|eukprot:ELU12895.1 hypothetical protein CAPTEDRAFT_173947 [Capitella teleta]